MDSNNLYFEGDIAVCGDITRDIIMTEYGRMVDLIIAQMLEYFVHQPGFQMTKAECRCFPNLKKSFVYDGNTMVTIGIERKMEIGKTAINLTQNKDCPGELWGKIVKKVTEKGEEK